MSAFASKRKKLYVYINMANDSYLHTGIRRRRIMQIISFTMRKIKKLSIVYAGSDTQE